MLYKEFYSELGKLLYAVADIDGVITAKEKAALHAIVQLELVPSENMVDEFGTKLAYYSEMEFDILDEEIADAEPAFESFLSFVEDHHTAFDESMKKVCLHVTEELAQAYHRKNKKVVALLAILKVRLEKIEVGKGKRSNTH